MLRSNLEYVPLRLMRRFVMNDAFLLKFGGFFPYYRTNRNQVDPKGLVEDYARLLSSANFAPGRRSLLEIGVGRTNSTGYEIAARFDPVSMWAYEPFVEISESEDSRLIAAASARFGCARDLLKARVTRTRELGRIADSSVDLVLSHSVLEHVAAPASLFAELRRIVTRAGGMLHLVDYRDHFFKYPLHFLQFDRRTWNRWLNPGDLPVWRLYDHVEQLEAAGFSVRVLEETKDPRAFAAVSDRVSPDFRRDDCRLQTLTAALWATPR